VLEGGAVMAWPLILKRAVLTFVAACCAVMLVWAFSGTARAQPCVTMADAVTQWTAFTTMAGVPTAFEVRSIGLGRRLLITQLPGDPPDIHIFENDCFVRSYAGPVLPLVPRAEA
jgi:hypothetical protein